MQTHTCAMCSQATAMWQHTMWNLYHADAHVRNAMWRLGVGMFHDQEYPIGHHDDDIEYEPSLEVVHLARKRAWGQSAPFDMLLQYRLQ